jgi:hypothetical protein
MGSIALEQKQQWMREKHSQCDSAPTTSPIERHYKVVEVAAMWSLSDDAVRKIFENEPGVIVLSGHSRGARRYRTLRIPGSVVERVHRRMSNV